MAMSEERQEAVQDKHPENRINLNPVRRLFERSIDYPIGHLKPYVTRGQVVADLGCNTAYYTLALSECVGPEGKVFVVDLDDKMIQALEKKVEEGGYDNIEARTTSAAKDTFSGSSQY